MPILTPEDKHSIESSVGAMHLEERHKLVRKEIFAALRIIEKTLGHEWYEKALKNYVQQDDVLQPSFFNGTNNIKEKYSAWGSSATQYTTNVKIKIEDYVHQERRGEPTLENFQRFFFELKTAYFWIKNGFSVEFIPKGKTETPDFKIVSPKGVTYIECKRKDVFTPMEKRFEIFAKNLSFRIFDCMESLKVNYGVEIKAEKEISRSEAESIISIINKAFESGMNFTENLGGISIEGKKLLNYGTVQILGDVNTAPQPPTIGTKFYFSHFNPLTKPYQFVSTAGCPNVEPFPADTRITNFKKLIVHAAFKPNKVQTVLNSVTDFTQLSLSGTGGSILAIETALTESDQELALMKQVFDNLPSILGNVPYVSAVWLLTIRTVNDEENQSIRIVTTPHVYDNPQATNKLLEDVEFALRQGKCGYNISFFSQIWDSKLK
jgi:hypothetical protein